LNIFLARQPILDQKDRTVGYEILYRTGDANAFPDVEGNRATLMVLQNLFCDMGIKEVAGGKLVFINITRELLLSDLSFLDPSNLVLEILEDVVIDQEVVRHVERLKEHGYRLALDDFEDTTDTDPLLPLVDIVKIDWKAHDLKRIESICTRLNRFGLALLAEKIESAEERAHARGLGFNYFQGYFFARPSLLKARNIPVSQMARFKLMAFLYNEEIDLDRVYGIISRDAGLTVKLLKLINSAAIGLPQKITSIQQAITLLGEKRLKRWLAIIILHDVAANTIPETFRLAVIRAFFMERMLKEKGAEKLMQPGFLVGLLSMSPALTGSPATRLLSQIPVHPVISNALLANKGPLAPFLLLCMAYEQGSFALAEKLARKLDLPLSTLSECYIDAVKEATMLDAARQG
jgi:EAL and modified HD-GYP domain-containing signal transduction protein